MGSGDSQNGLHDTSFTISFQSGDVMISGNSGAGDPTSNATNGSSNVTSNSTGNSSFSDFVEQLLIKESTEHREAVIVTSVFSLLASVIVIGIILYDARSFQRSQIVLRNGKIRPKHSLCTSFHPAEVFALAVAVAAVIQSLIFIGVQSTTLATKWATGCGLTAQLLWPASWLVAFMILVFSLEICFRSLRKARFRPRGRWTVPASVFIVILSMLGLWLAAFLSQPPDQCWGSLLWWTLHYGKVSLVLTAGMLLTNLITATVLVIQLVKTIDISKSERLAATRVVYALGVNVIILAFIVPFWITAVGLDVSKTASEIADIMVTLNGLLQAVLHIVLRVNSENFAIRPRQTPWAKKRRLRIFGANDVNIHEFISSPLILKPENDAWGRGMANDGQTLSPSQVHTPITPQRPSIATRAGPNLQVSVPARPAIVAARRTQLNTHYSLFPTEASGRPPVESWVTDISTGSNEFEPPPPLFTRRHGRNDSTQTSETVEFALRLSDAPPGMLSPVAPTPVDPVARSPLTAEEGILSPVRYVPPRTPTTPALSVVEPSQATRVAFERPKAPAALSTFRIQKFPKRTTSIRDSFAVLQQRRRQVDKSLPPLPRDNSPKSSDVAVKNTATITPLAPAPSFKTPNWREPSRQIRAQHSSRQSIPIQLQSPIQEAWPLEGSPRWI